MADRKKTMRIALAIAFTMAYPALSWYFSSTAMEWYKTLELPAFMPPAVLFPIVWGALYILLALSFALYIAGENHSTGTVLLYILNGVLNPLWALVFFRHHNLFGAFFLLIGIFSLAVLIYKRTLEQNKTAAILLLPYILWLAFVLYLNYETAFLN